MIRVDGKNDDKMSYLGDSFASPQHFKFNDRREHSWRAYLDER